MIADNIASWLKEKGITHVFGIIGAGNLALWDAIEKTDIEIVCCHHEQAAVLAAGFYFRASGRLAAALVTTGAGQANAVTGVISCWMDSTPVLVLSGNEPSKYMSDHTRVLGVQGFNVTAMIKDYVKCAFHPRTRLETLTSLERAYIEALTPRQGPVWVDVSRDVQCAP